MKQYNYISLWETPLTHKWGVFQREIYTTTYCNGAGIVIRITKNNLVPAMLV